MCMRIATCMWRRLRDRHQQQGNQHQREWQMQQQTPMQPLMRMQRQQRVRSSRCLLDLRTKQRRPRGGSGGAAWPATLQHRISYGSSLPPAAACIGRRSGGRRGGNDGGSCTDSSTTSSSSSDDDCCRRGRMRQTQHGGSGRCGSVRCGTRSPGDCGIAPGQPGAPICCPGG